MNYNNDTPSSGKYKHLSPYERGQIQLLNSEGHSPYAIGKRLSRASNTIRNELKRGTVSQIKCSKLVQCYFADTGQLTYERNRMNCGAKYKAITCIEFIKYVNKQFYDNGHSLDAIVGAARLNNKFTDQMMCTKTLYNYVDLGLLKIKNIDLPLKVKRNTKSERVFKRKLNLGRSISERPDCINDRSEFGHWEIDTVIGTKDKTDGVLLTITERKTRKEIIRYLPAKTKEAVLNSLKKLKDDAGELFPKVFKSITSDNGLEFADLAQMEVISDTKIYFAHPYTSCERGTNERHNGLIRRFIPKGNRINDYSHEVLSYIQSWCNSLPRKILGYHTPDEAFDDCLFMLTQ